MTYLDGASGDAGVRPADALPAPDDVEDVADEVDAVGRGAQGVLHAHQGGGVGVLRKTIL